MEHLGMTVDCKSSVDKQGWRIDLVLAGPGGEREAELVSRWLHEMIMANSHSVEMTAGLMQ